MTYLTDGSMDWIQTYPVWLKIFIAFSPFILSLFILKFFESFDNRLSDQAFEGDTKDLSKGVNNLTKVVVYMTLILSLLLGLIAFLIILR